MARAVPSGRDLRKYARLFLRTDHDSDGFISADEAKAVFNKSYLPPDVLINIFNQANVSQSPYLTFPEFVAAMHLIREARQTQQPSQFPSISAELMNFLSNFYESPWDLAIQGSSKSAQALKQSAQSAQSAHGDPTHQSFSKGDPTYQTQADSGLGQEKNGIDSVPPTPDFPSAGNFEAATETAFSDMAFADSDFGFGHAKTDKAEKAKGKRKKDKKAEKEKQEKKQKEENKEMTEMTEPSFGAEWTTFGQDPGLAAETHEIRENWPSFGNEHEMSFGLEDDKEKPKQKRRQKDQKDSQKDSEKGQNNSWSDDLQPQATRESFVPHFGQDSTDRPSWDLSLPQPRTRFGLPVSHGEQGREQQEQREQRDPDYVARLEEILGVSKVHAGEAVRLDKQNSEWAGRRHDGHFEERYRTAFMDLGDYGSPGVYVSLMGLKSNSHVPRVLPEPAKPFLKTVAPNFVPNFQAGVPGRSKPAFDLLRMR